MNMDQTLSREIDALRTQIYQVQPQHRADLQKMLGHCQHLWAEMSKEHVRCRRVWRLTPKYLELEQELKNTLTLTQQHVVLAALLGG